MEKALSLIDFAKMTIPMAVAFIVSTQVVQFVNVFQKNLISPFVGVLFSNSESLEKIKYQYNENIVFGYGAVLSGLINFLASIGIVYYLIRFASYAGVDASRRL